MTETITIAGQTFTLENLDHAAGNRNCGQGRYDCFVRAPEVPVGTELLLKGNGLRYTVAQVMAYERQGEQGWLCELHPI